MRDMKMSFAAMGLFCMVAANASSSWGAIGFDSGGLDVHEFLAAAKATEAPAAPAATGVERKVPVASAVSGVLVSPDRVSLRRYYIPRSRKIETVQRCSLRAIQRPDGSYRAGCWDEETPESLRQDPGFDAFLEIQVDGNTLVKLTGYGNLKHFDTSVDDAYGRLSRTLATAKIAHANVWVGNFWLADYIAIQ
jgi:hypothetical protein